MLTNDYRQANLKIRILLVFHDVTGLGSISEQVY